jgi:hypothetical protein
MTSPALWAWLGHQAFHAALAGFALNRALFGLSAVGARLTRWGR